MEKNELPYVKRMNLQIVALLNLSASNFFLLFFIIIIYIQRNIRKTRFSLSQIAALCLYNIQRENPV